MGRAWFGVIWRGTFHSSNFHYNWHYFGYFMFCRIIFHATAGSFAVDRVRGKGVMCLVNIFSVLAWGSVPVPLPIVSLSRDG